MSFGEDKPLGRIVHLLTATALAAGMLVALASPARAQTGSGDLNAFCAERIAANNTNGRKETLAAMDKLMAVAPTAVATQMKALRDAYAKQGDKLFDSEGGIPLLNAVDGWVYDNCPGKQQAVTAIDYQYQGMPATLPSGVTKFKLTNSA